jgi:ankyrin repeat protein
MDGQDNQEGLEVVGVEEEDFDAILARLEDLPLPRLREAFEARPELARVTDANGWTLLHHVVHRGMPAHCAAVVVHFWPESVRHRARNGGQLPMHLVNHLTQHSAADFLLDVWPEAVLHTYGPDEDGNFPFFCSIKNGARLRIVLRLFLQRYLPPDWDGEGGFPPEMAADHPAFRDGVRALQLALEVNAHLGVINLVLLGWPASLQERLVNGLTPVHLAIATGGARDVVEYLVHWRPAMVREQDGDGNLPIHYAGWHHDEAWRADADAARALIEAWPESLLEANHAGELPVHRAVQASSPALVQVLAELSPQSLHARNAAGLTPLHLAVARGPDASPGVVACLLDQHPGVLQQRDAHGLLPMALAVASRAPLDVLFLCVLKWPECVPHGGDRA